MQAQERVTSGEELYCSATVQAAATVREVLPTTRTLWASQSCELVFWGLVKGYGMTTMLCESPRMASWWRGGRRSFEAVCIVRELDD